VTLCTCILLSCRIYKNATQKDASDLLKSQTDKELHRKKELENLKFIQLQIKEKQKERRRHRGRHKVKVKIEDDYDHKTGFNKR
jgi:hypothetical protein